MTEAEHSFIKRLMKSIFFFKHNKACATNELSILEN